jgi:nucleoid-associated protein YgaU
MSEVYQAALTPAGEYAAMRTAAGRYLRSLQVVESSMFRALAIASLFTGITVALVLLQPDGGARFDADGVSVTRASDGLAGTAYLPAGGNVLADPIAAPENRPQDPQRRTPERAATAAGTDLQTMTRGVLAELGVAPGSLAANDGTDGADDPLRAMSLDALTGLRNFTGQPAPAPAQGDPLQKLIAKALMAGQSDAYIDALLNEAAGRGEIAVPRALVTAEGRVDTHVILSSIVAQATLAVGQEVPAPSVPGGDGVEVRMVQRADKTVEHMFYTVNSGDSLGAIAVKFYGDISRYTTIYEANRGLLSSPDRLRVGQRLVIPTI